MAGVIEITTVDDRPDASLEVSGGTPDQKGVAGRYSGTAGKWSFGGTATGPRSSSFPIRFCADIARRRRPAVNTDRDRGDVRAALSYQPVVEPSLSRPSGFWAVGAMAFLLERLRIPATSSRGSLASMR